MTAPGARVTVSVFPDGVTGDVTADGSGKWCWRPMKSLSPGAKSLLVVAKNADGQGQVAQTFTVVTSSGGFSAGWILLILILVALGFGGYVYYKSKNP